ncbi:MAG: hypothetical protein Q7S46_12380 [Gallionella sp.]|nr:hypothetical protein [Gallionella sp.]
MNELVRARKRLVIGVVFFGLVALLGSLVYFAFLKAPATCFDGKQNQDEEGVDCGGGCSLVCEEQIIAQNLEVLEVTVVSAGSGRTDILGKVRNPNSEAGATSFRYTFEIRNQEGTKVTREGVGFILPGEEKYLMALNVELTGTVTGTLALRDIIWERFTDYRGRPAINIYQRRYSELSGGSAFSEAYGLLVNESPYDFRSIRVKVVLRDAEGRALAFNATEMRTVQASEERDFRLLWPTAFPGTVARVEMEAEADVYSSENFIRQYLPGGRFQEFAPAPAF